MENQFETVFKAGDKVRLVRVPAGCRGHGFIKKNKDVVYTVEEAQSIDGSDIFYSLKPDAKIRTTRVNYWCVNQKDIRHVK